MIRKYLLTATLLSAMASPAAAEITFNIEEPAQDSVRSGIGLISGWAVSDVGIESVEAFMNGESLGFIPYGSPRGDVEAAFPHIPGSDKSGWAMKWGYSLAGEGGTVGPPLDRIGDEFTSDDLDKLLQVRQLGVSRVGASRTSDILDECRKRLST